jgi:rhomboid protease GluP
LHGEPWRLVTSAFLHLGIVHLAFNMYVLAAIGPLVERLFGRVRFLAVYLTAAITGSLVSLLVHRNIVAVGASGAIFGLYGALAAFLQRERGVMPRVLVNRMGKMAFGFIAYNLVFGFAVPGIDNAAHVGGLFGGAAAGWLLAEPLTPTRNVGRDLTRSAIALCIAAALAFAEIEVLPAPADFIGELELLGTTEEAVLAEYNGLVEKGRQQQISDDEFAERLETSIIPRWHAERERVARLGKWPPPNDKLLDLVLRYAETRELAFSEFARALRAHDPEAAKASHAIQAQADDLAKSIKQWKAE